MTTIRALARRILAATHYCANCGAVEVDYAGWICHDCAVSGAPQPK